MAVITVSQVVQPPVTDFLGSQLDIAISSNLLRPPAGGVLDPMTTNFIFKIALDTGVVGLEDIDAILVDLSVAAVKVVNLPIAIVTQQVKVVRALPQIVEEYADRIYMIPEEVDAGAVVSDQVRTFQVLNAHRRNSQFLASITPANDGGIVLVDPPGKPTPSVYCPGEVRTYSLEVDSEGPAVIDATYTFDWPAGSTPGVPAGTTIFSLIGFRVVLWPFPPTWRNPVTERIEYATDVLASDNATEQRMRLRKFPRKFYEYEASSIPDPQQGNDLAEMTQILDALLWGFQARVYALPVWTDCLILNADLPSGSSVIPVDPIDRDFFVGGLVVVFKSVNNFEVLNVDTLPGGQINLVSPTVKSFTGPVRIYPAHTARMQTRQGVTRPFDQFSFGNFSFQVDDNHEEPTPADPAVTFKTDANGDPIPVLQDNPERSVDLTHEFERKAFILDYLTSIRAVDDALGFPIETKAFRWVFGDRAQHSAWKAMIQSRAGRLKPIWVPSWHDDLKIVVSVGDLDTTITIRDIGYGTFYQSQPGRNHLQILLKDGTRVYVGQIISSATGAPGEEILTLDTAVGTAIPLLSDIVKVSFMGLFRLDADIVEISWPSSNNPAIELRFRLLPEENDSAV